MYDPSRELNEIPIPRVNQTNRTTRSLLGPGAGFGEDSRIIVPASYSVLG